MPRLSIEEAASLGLLGPEELSALGVNPFMPRAGASWTPTLGVRPGLTSSSFFRYPGISYRGGISPLRFGLGGLGQGLTLSPESAALGLRGIAGPVGRRPTPAPVGRGVAGGIAGGRAGIGAEGSGNLPPRVMTLPDGRRLVQYADGRQIMLPPPGAGGRPMPVMPEDYEALQALGLAGRGVGVAQQLARFVGTGGPEAGRTEGPGGEPGGPPVELAAPGGNFGAGGTLTMDPVQMAALGELGINTDLLPGGQPGIIPDITGTARPNLPPSFDFGGASLIDPITGSPVIPSPGTFDWAGKPGFLGPEPGEDLSLSPVFYAPGGASGADILDQSRNLYSLGLRPEDIQNYLMPEPMVGPGRGRDLDPSGTGVGPRPTDIFQEQGPGTGPGFDFNVTPGNTLGLLQSGIGVGQGALSGDPAALTGALLRAGMSANQIARLPGLNTGAVAGGAGGLLGILNTIQGARSGNIPGAVGGGLQTIGGAAGLAKSLGLLSGPAAGTVGAAAGGAGGLLSLATGIQGLIKGGVPPLQSALTMAGGATSTYSAIASLSAQFPELFGTVLPPISAGLDAAAAALGLGGAAAGSGVVGGIATGVGSGVAAGVEGGVIAGGGTASGALAAAAPFALPAAYVLQAVTDTIAEMERQRVMNAGFANNPIKGALYSQATASIAQANKILDAIKQTGDLSAVSTADLGKVLAETTTSMLPYYATAQGGRGAIRASDTITGRGADWAAKPYMGGQTPAEYTQKAEMAQAGIAGLVKELLKRGVTYEQIGQLPVSGDWAQASLDAGNRPEEMLARLYATPAPGQTESRAAEGVRLGNLGVAGGRGNMADDPNSPFGIAGSLLNAALGGSMLSSAENSKASGLLTSMYGGPLWAALARAGTADPELRSLIDQHFDPWVNARTWDPMEDRLRAMASAVETDPAIRDFQPNNQPLYQKAYDDYMAQKRGAGAPAPAPNFWEELAKQQANAAPAGPTAFNPLAFLSALQGGNRVSIRAGEETLQFVPYKPEQAASYTAKDSGYSELGTGSGIYVKPSGQGGTEVYVPQSSTQEGLSKALSGSTGTTGALGSALMPVPAGQEAGAVPGAGPAADIAPEPVAAGTASTAPTGSATTIPTGDQTPVPGSGGFKKGGMVPKTGEYQLHKGEVVIPADKANPGEGTDFLMDMAGNGDLKLGGEENRRLQMPKMGPGRLDRGYGPGPDGGSQPDDEARSVGGVRLAHHEQSETVQDESGKWVNVYGRNIKDKAGQPLPYAGNSYDTVEEAVEAAKNRSQEEGRKGSQAAEKWYVNMKEGTPSQDLDGTDPNVRRLAFTMEDVEDALEAGEAPIMVGKNILNAPPSLIFTTLKKAQDTQNKDPMKAPGIVAMAARMKRTTQATGPTPEGDTMPFPGMGEQILRGQVQRQRFPGDRGRGADVRLEDTAKPPSMVGPQDASEGRRPMVPGTGDRMPMIRTAPPLGNPFMTRAPFARAMHMAQNPGQMPVGQQPMDRMLENIDRGVTAPGTLQESIREQRRQLTPQDLMRRPMAPAPQPGLLEAIRRLTG